jgi:ABC-type nitrate/sulfonate/bicarbonate transport system substrate-binding protein
VRNDRQSGAFSRVRAFAGHLPFPRHPRMAGLPGQAGRRPLRSSGAACILAATAVILSACGSGSSGSAATGTGGPGGGAPKLAHITIALPVAEPVQSPVYLASKLGYFRQEGIDAHVIVLASDTAADAALVAGSVQYTSVNAVALIHGAEKGVPFQDLCTEYDGPAWALAVTQGTLSKTHVSAGMPVRQLFKALSGTKVAIVGTAASAPGLILAGLLKNAGLPGSTLSLVGVSASSDLAGAYQHGEVGAVFDTQPTPDHLVQESSGKVVFNTTQLSALAQIPWEGIVGSKSYIASNPRIDKGMCAAIAKADNYLLKNPSEAMNDLKSTFPKLSAAMLLDAIKSYHWAPGAGMSATQWTNAVAVMSRYGLIKQPSPSLLNSVFTTKYLPGS